MIGETFSHYRIVELLGAGGMGVVFKAEDVRLGRMVAVKFLPPHLGQDRQAHERFVREARTASSLNHPGICTIYEIDEHEGRPFIAMELLEGESLDRRITGQPLEIATIITYGIQIADALDAAHGQGVLHRDVKPANIFVTRRGQVKLVDFGLAKLTRRPRGADGAPPISERFLTTTGMTLGTVAYMSPEQARGEELDHRSDLFSFGVVLYEMATGRQTFSGATSAVVFDAILNRMPAAPMALNALVPEDLERVIAKTLEKDRELRYQNASDIRADLQRLRRDIDSGQTLIQSRQMAAVPVSTSASWTSQKRLDAAPTPQPSTVKLRAQRSSVGLTAAAIAALAIVGVTSVLLLRARVPAPPRVSEQAPTSVAVHPPAPAPAPPATPAPPPSRPTPVPEPVARSSTTLTSVRPSPSALAPKTPVHLAADTAKSPAAAPAAARGGRTSDPKPADPAPDLVRIARAKADAKLYDQALADLQVVVRDHAASPAAGDAYLAIAAIQEQQKKYDDAMATYVEARSRLKTAPQAAEAGYRLADLMFQSGRRDRTAAARETLADVAASDPGSEWAPRALALKARFEERDALRQPDATFGSIASAVATEQQLADRYPTHPLTESALWRLAGAYADLRRPELAAECLTKLVARFPQTRYDAWWELGELYDKRLRDKDKARDAYTQVPRSSPRYAQAQKKLKS
jgi:serine/threonine protein kinase/tetratricopeptide (TPR) repeat protein